MTSRTSTHRGSSLNHRRAWAATYDRTPYQELPWFDAGPSHQVAMAVTEKFLPKGAAVLDVGCGAGSNVLYLCRKGFQGFGVDLSPGAVQAAQARASHERIKANFRVGDALNLDFPDRKFGGVVDNGCFHTIPVRRRAAYAREVARVLRPGGSFVLSWVAREHTGARGPPHRPSLEEVTRTFEALFLFVRTEYRARGDVEAPSFYDARLTRRVSPQPPAR